MLRLSILALTVQPIIKTLFGDSVFPSPDLEPAKLVPFQQLVHGRSAHVQDHPQVVHRITPLLYGTWCVVRHIISDHCFRTAFTSEPTPTLSVLASHKHAYWLHTEDAYEELQCGLLEALKSLRLDRLSSVSQGVMVRYIQKIIRSQYIRLSKQRNKIGSEILLDDLNTRDTLQYIQRCSNADDYSHLLFSDARKILTSTEYRVIWLLYHENRSAAEAARALGKTRQAVNQVKQRALKKLRQRLYDAR